jgi:iron complex outermembrane receptor protein
LSQAAPVAEADNETGEVIVIVPGKRAEGIDDLRGDETSHVDASSGLEQPVFATVVRVQDSEGERRTVSEVLARTVGVSARSLGGLGAFSSISVRGADSSHTTVLVDGVPLSRIASSTSNLGQFELGSFESVELYRGGVPLELGGSGVGGAVNMRTALGRGSDGKALTLTTGIGSYGARSLRARLLGGTRGVSGAYQLSASYDRAKGDFRYFDDGGTALNLSDDRVHTRLNNGFDRIELLGRMRWQGWTLGSRSNVVEQGLPGAAHDQALNTSLHTVHQLVDARYDHPNLIGKGDHFHTRTFLSVERQRFSDPESEIGLQAQDSVYLTTSAGLGAGLIIEAGKHQRLLADIDSRVDWFRETPQGESMRPGALGNRQALALSLSDQLALADDALLVDLGVRAEALRTRPGADVFAPMPSQNAGVERDLYLSPRAAIRYRIAGSLSVKGSGGRYFRKPTLLEMFGDRGVVLGNSELEAEEGVSGDLGLVWAPARSLGHIDRVYVEAVAFASRPDKPIVFVNRNGLAAQAINLEGARVFGSELVASMRAMGSVTITGNYSFLDARNRAAGTSYDKRLPGRPGHRLYGRVDAAFSPRGRLLVVWTDALRLSGNYVDELNVFELPPRSLIGAGIKTTIYDDLLLGVEVKNASDLRSESVELDPPPSDEFRQTPKALSDLHGYPLPGRSFYLTLQWSH